MRIEIDVTGDAPERIRELAQQSASEARERLIEDAMALTLTSVIMRNPVDTARSRAAWVQSLEELGRVPPAGWEGPHPIAVSEGRRLGTLKKMDSTDVTQINATNSVDYVRFLEYGSSRTAPFAMVRAALQRITHSLSHLFRLS
ncbi:hypothetical protein SH668x_000312 [Planctomicrobium sp. SH668]|uniref:hypothetical protein n=1 Tax=Planctomicrobium sp. SH668 TaxID=3448126 RepID=UPI003F5BA408